MLYCIDKFIDLVFENRSKLLCLMMAFIVVSNIPPVTT